MRRIQVLEAGLQVIAQSYQNVLDELQAAGGNSEQLKEAAQLFSQSQALALQQIARARHGHTK